MSNDTTEWRYTASSQEVIRTDGVLIAREVPPEFGKLVEAAPELSQSLRRCLGLICETADLNNYRNLSDQELGKVWVAVAEEAGHLLNRIDGIARARQ